MDLKQKANEFGFVSKIKLVHENLKSPDMGDLDKLLYYLWMCELQKWLREVHNIHIEIRFIGYADLSSEYHTKVNFIKDGLWEYILVTKNKSNLTYREAFETGLMTGLKLI